MGGIEMFGKISQNWYIRDVTRPSGDTNFIFWVLLVSLNRERSERLRDQEDKIRIPKPVM